MYKKTHHIHFVGIGGIGMSGIAELLINLGYRVSGSDISTSEITGRLSSLGAKVYDCHSPANIKDADVVVTSSAVKKDNPEVVSAVSKNIPVIPRAEMLGELMRLKYAVAVAGSHGKTTTTSLIANVFEHGSLSPTVVTGGILNKTNTNTALGSGDFLVAEADESDGSFLKLPPTIAVVTNIDREHTDYYADLEAIKQAFLEFMNKVPFYGLSIICLDDPHLQSMIPQIRKRVFTYGFAAQADLQARDIVLNGFKSTFSVFLNDKKLGTVSINIPGKHNISNALAAIAAGIELGIAFKDIKKGLSSFKGIRRRFELRAEKQGIRWIDDYAHHPSEIGVTLKAVKGLGAKRVVVLFQPHRYTRTEALFEELTTSFYDADMLFITDIYAAGESPIPGVNAQNLIAGITQHGHKDAVFVPSFEAAQAAILKGLKEGDILLSLGAGDVWKAAASVMNALEKKIKAGMGDKK